MMNAVCSFAAVIDDYNLDTLFIFLLGFLNFAELWERVFFKEWAYGGNSLFSQYSDEFYTFFIISPFIPHVSKMMY